MKEACYQVKSRLPPKWGKIKIYTQKGEFLGEREAKFYSFLVESQQMTYELKTKSNGLYENDIIRVYFENGDYKIKKVDKNG